MSRIIKIAKNYSYKICFYNLDLQDFYKTLKPKEMDKRQKIEKISEYQDVKYYLDEDLMKRLKKKCRMLRKQVEI